MQFDRTANLTIAKPGGNAQVFDGFKMTFEVTKDVYVSTNTARIEIHNLSQKTRDTIKAYESQMTLNAGYVENGGAQLLFSGQIFIVEHRVKPPEIITKLQTGDGFAAFRESHTSLSFAPGTQVSGVFQALAKTMGLPISAAKTDAQFPNGFSFAGQSEVALRKAANAAGFECSVQNSRIILLPRYSASPEAQIEISQATGMIESPEKVTNGTERLLGPQAIFRWKVKTLLNPSITPYRSVRLKSRFVNGDFRVQSVRHSGDTRGENWFSEVELCNILIGGLGQ